MTRRLRRIFLVGATTAKHPKNHPRMHDGSLAKNPSPHEPLLESDEKIAVAGMAIPN
jgi:hypothetical protein